MAQMEIKGITLKSRYDFVMVTYGRQAFARLLSELKKETRALFSNPKKIRATGWYPLEVQSDFDKTVCEHLADGDVSIFRKLGAFSAEYHESHLNLGDVRDPAKFLQTYAVIFHRFFRPGKVELKNEGPTEFYLRFFDFTSTKENCETNVGYLIRAMEIMGLKDIIVEETQCTREPSVGYCEYRIKWRN